MGFKPGQSIKNTPVDVCFIGSCTNGRISDLRVAANVLKDKKVSKNIKAFVVPGSEKVPLQQKKVLIRSLRIRISMERALAAQCV